MQMICLQQSGRCCDWQLHAGRNVIYMSYTILNTIIFMVQYNIMNDICLSNTIHNIVLYFIYDIHTVDWFDGNSVLDETTVDVDHQ